ncbi:MAG: FGGY-family carbohydrate kinase [Mesorhizobium sp.]
MTGAATLGLDFGTGSARVVMIDLNTGGVLAEHTVGYQRGFLDETTAPEMKLAPNSAIQDPADFIRAAEQLLEWAAQVAASLDFELRAIGVSATSCTILPTLRDGTPLLQTPAFAGRLHAFAKLWKHHAADHYARRIAAARPRFLERYNNQTSSEWSLAKAWQTMADDPALWEATERWIDAGDWIVWQLTGRETRSASHAGCKNHWQPDLGGYPELDSLEAIQPGLGSWLEKLAPPHPLSTSAGPLTRHWQEVTGIGAQALVGVAMVDAEAAVPGSDVDMPGILVAAAGTSTCHMSLSAQPTPVAGIESLVYGGAVDGLYDYCTGQAASGDMLAWLSRMLAFDSNSSPEAVLEKLVDELDGSTSPSPVHVMDWWSGCRTPLGRADLGGIIANIKTTTMPVEIYRAMLEAGAMGMRYAYDLHRQVGPIHEIRITGGMARFSAIMQIYADVMGQTVRANSTVLGSARGAAISAAKAAKWVVPASLGYSEYEPRQSERYGEHYRQYCRHIEQASASTS